MGVFAFVLVVLLILRSLLLPPEVQQRLPLSLRLVLSLLTPLLAVPAAYYCWKLFAVIRRRLLWKIRRRLILAHIFIGAIPVLLILLIVWVSALLFYYQLSYYLIANQIGIHTGQIHAFNVTLRTTLLQVSGSSLDPAELKSILDRDSKYLLASYPSASIILRYQDSGVERSNVIGSGSVKADLLSTYQVPRWTWDKDFYGLVLEDAQPELYRDGNSQARNGGAKRLFIRSFVISDYRSEFQFSLEVSVPFDRYMLDRLKAALGQDLLLANGVAVSALNVMLQNTDILKKSIESATFDLENDQGLVGRPVWSILLFPVAWSSGTETSSGESDLLFVELSTTKLFQNLFHSESNVSKTILGVLQIVIGFFLAVEIVSVILGIVLTKSITNSVHNLDRGTEFVRRGDFSHRIVVKSADQLGALAASFNQMTEYVQALVKERVQKERLERELEIAKEVQEQLFPRSAPRVGRMEITGICLPARVVSGDYYDFLTLGTERLGMALGDICGKGISAALLMANLQATLRSNVMNLSRGSSAPDMPGNYSNVAAVVQLLNEQFYNYTSANKYASFFYALYDDAGPTLTYCNAGHNPPLYFNGDAVRRLTTGGTVVGIFPDAEFEQETLNLRSGDLLLAYTDGIVESVNEYGEEFGEDRLVGIVKANRTLSAEDIQKTIVQEVLGWSFEEERDDDMTILVAKIR